MGLRAKASRAHSIQVVGDILSASISSFEMYFIEGTIRIIKKVSPAGYRPHTPGRLFLLESYFYWRIVHGIVPTISAGRRTYAGGCQPSPYPEAQREDCCQAYKRHGYGHSWRHSPHSCRGDLHHPRQLPLRRVRCSRP